jgi:hypothetical protein
MTMSDAILIAGIHSLIQILGLTNAHLAVKSFLGIIK